MIVQDIITLLESVGIEVEVRPLSDRVNDKVRGLNSVESAKQGELCYSYVINSTITDGIIFVKNDLTMIERQFLIRQEADRGLVSLLCDEPKTAFIIASQEFAKNMIDPDWYSKRGCHIQNNACSTFIDSTAKIGPGCCIFAGTTIEANVVIEPNTVIGATGTNFKWHHGVKYVMPQVGGVTIGEGCFIGSNVTIVRGAFNNTVIQDGVRIAHGSQIGHDVTIGAHAFLANGVNVAGYVEIGERCWIGSGVSIKNRITIGKRTKVGCGAVVVRSCGCDLTIVGVPAKPIAGIE